MHSECKERIRPSVEIRLCKGDCLAFRKGYVQEILYETHISLFLCIDYILHIYTICWEFKNGQQYLFWTLETP